MSMNSVVSRTRGPSYIVNLSEHALDGRVSVADLRLLFCATTINYVDRQVLGVLAPQLQSIIGWNEIQYGYIVTAFQAAYALGLLVVGRFIDRFGTRIGYAVAIGLWKSRGDGARAGPYGAGIRRGAISAWVG